MRQIIRIVEKSDVSLHLQTVDVLVSTVQPKHADSIIRCLSKISPLENLQHVKRIQKRYIEGKLHLMLILCVASENTLLNDIPENVQHVINQYQLCTATAKVCKYAATTREEWEEQCKLWPTSYHPPANKIDGISGFSEADSELIYSNMAQAINLAKSCDGVMVNAAIIVDPLNNQVISQGCDQCFSPHISSGDDSDPSGPFPDSIVAAACLNPWQWSEQRIEMSSSTFHPLRHAAIVAINSSAQKGIELFPAQCPHRVQSLKSEQWKSSLIVRLKLQERIFARGLTCS